MSRWRLLFPAEPAPWALPLLLVVGLVLALAVPAGAVGAGDAGAGGLLSGGIDPVLEGQLGDPDRLLTVMVDLPGDPVAVAEAGARERGDLFTAQSATTLRADLRHAQADLAASIEGLGGRVLAGLQDAYNGLRVQLPAGLVDDVAALPGALAVRALPVHELANVDSTRYIGAPEAWEGYGLTGEGTSVAVVDTGIDYLHADFGGIATEEAYAANDPAVVEPGSFPTAKVVGGYDFAGDAYDPLSSDPEVAAPAPDPDPMDCQGHGTHVAGTAAGTGVTAAGATFNGPYSADVFAGQDFMVDPGVAPEADVYALKVFGCTGSTNLVVDAINWAVANDVDVINLSLGATFGAASDPSSIAANNAALAGVVVVTAAGNEGGQPYVTGSPAAGEATISVAAVDSRATVPAASLVAGTDTLALQNSNGAGLDEPVTGEVAVLHDDPATQDDESLGCAAGDYAGIPEGAIVVTFRGVCPRIDRAVLGQAAGAAVVVMVNDSPALPPVEGPIDNVTIPFLGASQDQGERLSALHGQTATVEAAPPLDNPTYRAPADFTSGGPAVGTSAAKPDVAAPGVSIRSAAAGTGTGARAESGTSMAAPHVAGLAALTVQARPDWPVDALKAAIVNTADPDQVDGYDALLVGAGLVRSVPAVATTAVATGDPLTASLNFGFLEGTEPTTFTKTVDVWNHGTTAASFEAGARITNNAGDAGVVAVEPASFTVEPGSSQRLTVTLHLDFAAVPPGFDSIAGLVVLRSSAGLPSVVDALRVPFLAIPKGTSELHTTPETVRWGEDVEEVYFTTANAGPVAGGFDVFAWGFTDEPGDAPVADIRAVGVQADPDVDPTPGTTGLGVFAINTHGPASTFSSSRYRIVIDTDENRLPDHAVTGVDGSVVGGEYGVPVSVVTKLPGDEIIAWYPTTEERNASTFRLPFALSDIGVSPSNPEFAYAAGTITLTDTRDEPQIDTVFGRASFNAFDQPLETGQSGTVVPGAQEEWLATVDAAQLGTHPQLGWMVVYPQNRSGEPSSQLIPFTDAPTP